MSANARDPFNRQLNGGNADKIVNHGGFTVRLHVEVGTFPVPAEPQVSDLNFCLNGSDIGFKRWQELYNTI